MLNSPDQSTEKQEMIQIAESQKMKVAKIEKKNDAITLDFKAQLLVGKACMPLVNETVSFSLEACLKVRLIK